MTHELKINTKYYQDVIQKKKTFEVRLNDRNYQEGDKIKLCEYDEKTGYTGRTVMALIIYIFDNLQYLRDGYVILGITILGKTIIEGYCEKCQKNSSYCTCRNYCHLCKKRLIGKEKYNGLCFGCIDYYESAENNNC